MHTTELLLVILCKSLASAEHAEHISKKFLKLYFYQNFAHNRAFGLPGIFNICISARSCNTGKQYFTPTA